MKKRIALAALVALAVLLPIGAWGAATKARIAATLDYFEDSSGTFRVVDETGDDIVAEMGLELKLGWSVVTGKGDVAEIRLQHNGTIIRLSQNTNFRIDALGDTKTAPNNFSVAIGKIRTVAGRATGNERYTIKGQSAVCGVSGTDFVFSVDVDAGDEELYTLEGSVDFTVGGQTLQVLKGFMSSLKNFTVIEIPSDLLQSLTAENTFRRLNPLEVPQAEAPAGGAEVAEAPAEAPAEGAVEGAAPPPPMKSSALDGIMAKLGEILGLEIGAVVIDGVTWQKVVVQPEFKLGKLGLGLYLPVIYQTDMLNSADWYHPSGNNEWSFGFDQSTTWGKVQDFAVDLALKVKYLEWGQQRDPFFLKAGNLDDITLGHGLIMRNYANDAEFPAVRRVGLNIGVDASQFGFEWMVSDFGNLLAMPTLFADPTYVPDVITGLRLYFRPIKGFRMALGGSIVADFGASAGFSDPVSAGMPIFLNFGPDLDLPFVESDFLSIVAFADAALMVPYFRGAPDLGYLGVTGSPVPAGLRTEAVFNRDAAIPFKNYGAAAGLFGNIWVVDWRLEYRYYTGTFTPAFYNDAYERSRSQYVQDVVAYLANPLSEESNVVTMGIYGEGGFTLNKIMSLDLGYFWPWDPSGVIPFSQQQDRAIVKFVLEPGVIPVVNISGYVSYERTNFMPTILAGQAARLFDANTVVRAEIDYPIAPTMDIALFYTTTAKHDEAGNVVYEPGKWLPELSTTLTFETRVHF